jgi:hypothetical protein
MASFNLATNSFGPLMQFGTSVSNSASIGRHRSHLSPCQGQHTVHAYR